MKASKLSEPIPAHVATAAEFREALLAIRPNLTDNMLALLRFQYRATERTATPTDLAKSLGYSTDHPARRQYEELGRLIAAVLNFTPPRRADGVYSYWCTLSTGDSELNGGDQRFVMRPELATAVAELRWGGHA
ncbi:MAG: hypothetical protein C0467_27875 [Planctomycetaceae bacterium]|nr:hypothetical protein [Planctomycetaceae bacterium]